MRRIVDGKELDSWLKISPSTRWRHVKNGRLPPPRKLHPNGPNIWFEEEIDEIIDSLPIGDAYRNCGVKDASPQAA